MPKHPLKNDSNLIPDSDISQEAYHQASKYLPEAILHQSIRVYLYAGSQEKAPSVSWPAVLLGAHLKEPEWEGCE